jgi:hypothetical protein
MRFSYPILILLCVASLAVGLVGADTVYKLAMPQRASVSAITSVEVTIADALWTNGTIVEWGGGLIPGKPIVKPLTFTNVGTTTITSIAFNAVDLPNGWVEVLEPVDLPLGPEESVEAFLTLTPALNATSGVYLWNCYFTVS